MPGLDRDWFSRRDIRIFQPCGGMPAEDAAADVASAGVPIVAALVSLLGGHLVRTDVALTGAVAGAGNCCRSGDLPKEARCRADVHPGSVSSPPPTGRTGSPLPGSSCGGLELVFAATAAEALSPALARHRLKGYLAPS